VPFLIAILLALFAPAAAGQPLPIVVGAVVSLTGAAGTPAEGYRNALLLWEAEINAAGGLLGRRVELHLRDDASDAVRAGALYGALIREARADVLIGPYGSAATIMAATEAERAGRVLINGAGAAERIHAVSPRYVFQSAQPYSAYGRGVLELARAARIERLFILARNDIVSREMALATHAAAARLGLQAAEVETYGAGAADFAPQIARARAAGARAWIAFGQPRDAAAMVRSFKKLGYAPELFFARGAFEPQFIELVGQDAEYAMATRAYDARWRTAGNERFAAAYAARFGRAPDAAAAEGFAAATVLAESVRRAASLDQEALRKTLAEMEIETVLGGYRVGPDGAQLAAAPAVVQILLGRREVLWPWALRTAAPAPYVPWDERRVLE
jgi:branched-chain amino acid transport system substrate-binding protein